MLVAAADDQPGSPGHPPAADPEASTLADGEWPVARQYQVTPQPQFEEPRGEEGHRAAGLEPPPFVRAWFREPPWLLVLAVAAALLLVVGGAAAWFVTRSDSSSPARRGTHQATPSPSTTPSKGTEPGASTSTSTASTSTTATTTTTSVRTVAVPDVVGLSASEGAQKLREAELVPRIRLVASSRDVGTVLDQRPGGSEKLDVGSVVVLEVAKKRAASVVTTVSIPRLVGSSAADAKGRLRSLGLHWNVSTRSSDSTRGTVLAQDPAPGAKLERGATVSLTVSSGPSEVSVPDVTGLDAASARAQLHDAGFDVSVVDQPTSDADQDGVVVDQSPTGGSSAAKGSTVTITVARLS